MPVKKKRKSSGVAAAVAEDGGLKKCKISRYHLSPTLRSLLWLDGQRKGGAPGLGGSGWGAGTPAPREPGWPARSAASLRARLHLVLAVRARAPVPGPGEQPRVGVCVPCRVGR